MAYASRRGRHHEQRTVQQWTRLSDGGAFERRRGVSLWASYIIFECLYSIIPRTLTAVVNVPRS